MQLTLSTSMETREADKLLKAPRLKAQRYDSTRQYAKIYSQHSIYPTPIHFIVNFI